MEDKNKVITVIVDGYGGDNAPFEVVKGAVLAVNEYKEIKVILTGKQEELQKLLSNYKYDKSKIEILNANSIISNEESPVDAIRTKKDSSLVVALDKLKQDDNVCALISAGSTGAVLTGGFLKIGRLNGIRRPALAPVLPTITGGHVTIIDCGANMDTTSENLLHFALMGSLYMESMYGITSPRVALLNVGIEDKKGNELVKETFPLMKALPINFVGNMEARDTLSGNYDVIVCDGFAGNVLLKGSEGAVSAMLTMLKNEIKASKMGMIGALFMKGTFARLKEKLDHSNKGGSPFLGAKKIIIKSHGSSTGVTIKTCIKQAMDLENAKMYKKLSESLKELNKNKEE